MPIAPDQRLLVPSDLAHIAKFVNCELYAWWHKPGGLTKRQRSTGCSNRRADGQRQGCCSAPMSSRTLAEASGSPGHAGRTVGYIGRLEDAEAPAADTHDPDAVENATSASAPCQPPSEL